jgi:uncharacterized membrane protein YkgB
MCDPDLPENRHELRRMGRRFLSVGATGTLVSGTFLILTDDAWASNSLWWGGLFGGIMISGFGVMMWRDAVFAPPLTPVQRRYHEFLREWGFYDHS